VPHIKQSSDYVLTRPGYVPFAYTTPTGNELSNIYTDDVFSPLINLPFPVCFYGTTYNSLVMGSNAIITFDGTNANGSNSWPLTTSGGSGTPVPIPYAGGTQNSSFSTYYPKASIMGPYHDIYPTTNGSGQRKIEWRVEGVAPKRRFIGSYNSVPMFSCTTTYATSQIVIYEGTGIVEIYVHDKPICSGWNSGLAILGIQNFNRDKAVAAEGKNCTVWGGVNIDSCYRFIPTAGTSMLKSAQLVVNGTVVANADTSTLSPGVLNLNFPNVCPVADSTAYVIRVTYKDCNGDPQQDIVFTDTVFVKKVSPAFTFAKTDPTCSPNGTITVSASGGTGPYQYSINGGTTYQSSNTFTGLAGGTYSIVVKDANNCVSSPQPVSLTLVNTMTITVAKTDGNCSAGGTITVTASGGGNPPYQYSINGGTTYQASNTFTGVAAGTYNVIAQNTGSLCTASQSVTVAFTNNLTLNPINGASVCLGNTFTPSVQSNAATYSWSPTTGVSNVNIANPVITPTGTTTYTVTATLGSCTKQQSVTVSVFPGATAFAGPDATIIAGDVYAMQQATASAGTYLWTPSTGLNNPSLLNPNANPLVTTTYTLKVTSPQGCIATDDMVITVVPYCIKPMEAITPNGDGINERWLITNGNCLTSAKAQVFNRYGAKVFESSDYKNTWDGTYEGKPLPDGTYYYVISYKLVNGRIEYLKGNLTILR
jgi:gliding motility-associated-like protein